MRPLAVTNPLFKLLLWFTLGICFASLVAVVALAFLAPDPMSKAQERALELSSYAFTTTLGAIVGLVGGRAAHPDYLGQLPVADEGATSESAKPRPPKAKK
jgi:hypothetical protein